MHCCIAFLRFRGIIQVRVRRNLIFRVRVKVRMIRVEFRVSVGVRPCKPAPPAAH